MGERIYRVLAVLSALGVGALAVTPLSAGVLNIGQRGTGFGHAQPSPAPNGGFPENTIPAFEWAFQHGADMIEIDIRLTADDQVVVFHDHTMERTSDAGPVAVRGLTLEQIKTVDVGSFHDPVFAGLQVPTLGEAAAVAQQFNRRLWLDIKWPDMGAETALALANAGMSQDQVIFNVLTDQSRDSIRQDFPDAPIYWKWDHREERDGVSPPANPDPSFFDTYVNRGYAGVELWGLSGVTKEFVDVAASRGLNVVVWGTHFASNMAPMIDAGVFGVVTYDVSELTGLNLLAGDLNSDGFVGLEDLNLILGNWNQAVPAGNRLLGDPSGDGFVGLEDLNQVLGVWNVGTPPPPVSTLLAQVASIPEPASLTWLLTGAIGCLTGRTKRRSCNRFPR